MIDENIENQIEENNDSEKNEITDVEGASSENTSEEVNVEIPEAELAISNNEMINYLDPSIINIKKYEYSELDEMNESDILEANAIYVLGLDKKDRITVGGYKKAIKKFVRDKAVSKRVVKNGKRDMFTILTHNFYDIRNYIKIKGKLNEE